MIEEDNGLRAWPEHWPQYKQGREPCDALVGPCACGAWHQLGEFSLRPDGLYRYNKLVPTRKETNT